MSLPPIEHLSRSRKDTILADLSTFLKFPSISSDHKYHQDCLSCAYWLHDYLFDMGLTTALWHTKTKPIVYAERIEDSSYPTALFLLHYDVQPEGEKSLWKTPPFSPTIVDNKMVARGAQDNKGQAFYVITAIKAMLELDSHLPINVKMIFDGEEECGSEGLLEILPSKKEVLQTDYLFIPDCQMYDYDTPQALVGVRGILALSLLFQGMKEDVHSGIFGGIVRNPVESVISILSSMKNSWGHVSIPGFYEDIKKLSEEEKKQLDWKIDTEQIQKKLGCTLATPQPGFSLLESNWIRPTLEINGIESGVAKTGFMTIIPSQVYVNLSCRLVPYQDPEKVKNLIINYLKKELPPGITLTVQKQGGCAAAFSSLDGRAVRAVKKAYQSIRSDPCLVRLDGASIPTTVHFIELLKCETVLFGMGLLEDSIHAPNESFGIDRFFDGVKLIASLLRHLKN